MSSPFPKLSRRPSIYEFIVARVDGDGRLDDSGLSLPDENPSGDGIRWAAGAMDGVFGHHGSGGNAKEKAAEVGRLLVAVTNKRHSKRRLARLYRAVSADSALDFIDQLVEELVRVKANVGGVHDVGRWLAETASDRNATKVGLALLGITGVRDALQVVRTLGAHEEFTLYAAVALCNGMEDHESELWALARSVEGWGRIECVDRLRETTNPEIRDWILREGFRNSIMYEYLAYAAATTGNLRAALAQGDDRELLTSAGEILDALIVGGPAEDIADYADAAEAVSLYLGRMADHASTTTDFNTVASIREFLCEDRNWDEAGNGWSGARQARSLEKCDEILGRPLWREIIGSDLRSSDPAVAWRANRAARTLDIDTFELHFEKVVADPLGGPWFEAWQQADEDRARRLVALAATSLPLSEIASGIGSSNGFGPEWRAHTALDWTLQDLRRFPSLGGELIAVGLQSPVIRNRNMALKALEAWRTEAWPAGARQLVEHLAKHDPYEATQELARDLVNRP